MLDFGHLPKPLTGTIDYFPGFSTTAGQWEVWNKPRNCMFIRILCIGGGGGGGSGGSANGSATTRGGGGGGASSAMTTLTIPAVFVPDRLYVSAGIGGLGGIGINNLVVNGNNGVPSMVSIAPTNINIYILCYSNSGAAGGGGGSSGGAGGAGGAVVDISTANQGFQGHFNSIAGQNGAGGSTGAGGSIAYPTTGLLLSGGSGGGGILNNSSSSAGSVNAPASQTSVYTLFPSLIAAAFTAGQHGIELSVPLMSCGGVGGGAFVNGGDDGGNGGFGSGGGGGGASVIAGAVGGDGGRGGNGLVVIQTW